MEKSDIRLKQLLISITMLVTISTCFQAFAKIKPESSDYRLQKVVSTSNNLDNSTQHALVENQSTNILTETPKPLNNSRSKSLDTLPLFLLALSVIGLAVLLFIPGRYIRKPIILDEDTAKSTPEYTEDTTDTYDAYIESMDAEDEIEKKLAAEEELDSINTKIQGRIRTRDRKYQNRVLNRRKK